MNTSPDSIRRIIREEYGSRVAEAPERPAVNSASFAAGCGCGSGTTGSKGLVVDMAGYAPDQLAGLPDDAVVNSFGCGNPVALAGLRPGDTVLDLGCGAGIDLLLAARLVGSTGRVIGVDMTDEMIEKARGNVAAAGLSTIEVRKGLIEELPVEDSSIDWVISNCVINLSPEKPRVFKEIARVLRPGGQMLVSDMMARDLPEELLRLPAAYSSCVAGAIDEDAYLDGLRAAGLASVQVRDRLIYDSNQLAAAALSQVDSSLSGNVLADLVRRYAGELEGKIWSAKVYARKP